jgi:hypothetical protein
MSYQLILSEPIEGTPKDVGENVFFDNLSSDYKVFIFYYAGAMPDKNLESALRNLGNIAGKNLFVNIGLINDDKYPTIGRLFDIKPLPVIIVTAIDKLASAPTEFSTAYVKIEDKRLLNSTNLAIDCVQTVFNLFIQEKISEAMSQVKRHKREALISNLLKGMREFLDKRDIIFGIGEFRLELKRSGG